MTASPATATVRNRRYKRVTQLPDFQISWQCPGFREVCPATDLNQGGLFLITRNVQSAGTTIKMKIPHPGGDIPVNAVVRDAAENGMGVEFVAVGTKERAKLDLMVKKLLLAAKTEEELRKKQPPAPKAQAAASSPASEAPALTATATATATRAPKKRKFERVNLPKGLKVAWTYGKQSELTIAGTVSVGGLFVLSQQPAPVGSSVRLLFDIPGGEVLATAVVRNLAPGRGMGIEFTDIRPEDRKRLDELLNRLMS